MTPSAVPFVSVGDCDVSSGRLTLADKGLGKTEVQNLDDPLRSAHDVRRLQIAMDDAFLVRRPETLGDLYEEGSRFIC